MLELLDFKIGAKSFFEVFSKSSEDSACNSGQTVGVRWSCQFTLALGLVACLLPNGLP